MGRGGKEERTQREEKLKKKSTLVFKTHFTCSNSSGWLDISLCICHGRGPHSGGQGIQSKQEGSLRKITAMGTAQTLFLGKNQFH